MPKSFLDLLEHSNHRTLPADYSGDVLLWDIDKTYLDTRFSSWRGLAAIPFELAIDKQSIPGAVPLLRALRRGPGPGSALVPLYFVSGSPVQLRRVIERRMTMDGVDFDGITFKDQLGLVLRGRSPKRQIGYKLTALLLYRGALPPGAGWLMFGDDAEQDATIFALFGEICAGLRDQALDKRLTSHGVAKDAATTILELAAGLPVTDDPVDRIFIHLDRGSSPSDFSDPRTIPTRSYLQTAACLRHMGRIGDGDVAAVAKDLRRRGRPEVQITADLEDARRRLGVPVPILDLARG